MERIIKLMMKMSPQSERHANPFDMVRTKLYQFRKAYLTNFLRFYYSQFGEDVIIRSFIRKQRAGFFVDVGCYHPKKYSNTYWLYKRGWRGINVDMEQHKIALFDLVRRRDVNITAAVANVEADFFIGKIKQNDLGATLITENKGGSLEQARTKSLDAIIGGTLYANTRIDLLTVDAEGYDLEVLKSLDFAKYQPRFLIVETNDNDIDDIIRSELYQYALAQGYFLKSWCIKSLFFIHQSEASEY